jgi:hypothetical protein
VTSRNPGLKFAGADRPRAAILLEAHRLDLMSSTHFMNQRFDIVSILWLLTPALARLLGVLIRTLFVNR